MTVSPPILLVHGIWDDGARFRAMRAALEAARLGPVHAIDLKPNDGRARIEVLAAQVDEAARALAGEPRTKIDVVGFSMGALVSRYWLQRLGGRERARRFVSISGPHHGTATAWALPLAGAAQMRPGSPLLTDLATDDDPFGDAEAFAIWTRWDLMILPPRSSALPGARETHELSVPMHRAMITHPEVLSRVVAILARAEPASGV